MRTDIHFILTCSNCGETLECDLDKSRNGGEGHSAFNAEMHMAIKPCEKCYDKARRPGKLIAEALKEIGN